MKLNWETNYVAYTGNYRIDVTYEGADQWDWSVRKWNLYTDDYELLDEAAGCCGSSDAAKLEAEQALEQFIEEDKRDKELRSCLRGERLDGFVVDEAAFLGRERNLADAAAAMTTHVLEHVKMWRDETVPAPSWPLFRIAANVYPSWSAMKLRVATRFCPTGTNSLAAGTEQIGSVDIVAPSCRSCDAGPAATHMIGCPATAEAVSCVFCGEHDVHECPGGEYMTRLGRGTILPGKVDARAFPAIDSVAAGTSTDLRDAAAYEIVALNGANQQQASKVLNALISDKQLAVTEAIRTGDFSAFEKPNYDQILLSIKSEAAKVKL